MDKKELITVYVAGSITPLNPNKNPQLEFLENVKAGIEACVDLILLGYAPICTFFDFFYWLSSNRSNLLTIDMIHDVSTALLSRCKALLILPNSHKSSGVKKEVKKAKKFGIPIFYSIVELDEYFKTKKGRVGHEQVGRG
jgi:hypothetical protein